MADKGKCLLRKKLTFYSFLNEIIDVEGWQRFDGHDGVMLKDLNDEYVCLIRIDDQGFL